MLTYYLITALHVIVCIILILVVLLQSGKGADLAGAFGGGATQTAFGSRGPASFLSKLTTIAAVVFMVTSLSLAMIGNRQEAKSLMDETTTQPAVPAPKKPAAQPAAPLTPEQIRQRQEEIEKKAQQAPAQGTQTPAPAPQTPAPAAPKNAPKK